MYQKILAPVDGSDTSERGLREAIALAADQKARLVLLHVVDDYPVIAEMANAAAYEGTLQYLRDYGNGVLARGKASAVEVGVEVETCLREISQRRVADLVVDEARKLGCDLIVMGTHGRRGFSRLALGSDADLVVRASPVPVLLVKGETPA